jgi:hygromycin-B 7''-O-kinase
MRNLTTATPDARLSALAANYGVPRASLPLVGEGATAVVYGLDEDRVIRVPRGPNGFESLRREVAVNPAAVGLGLAAPRLLCADDPPTVLDVPHAVMTRVSGATLEDEAAEESASVPALRSLGRQLALLHRAPLPDPVPHLRDLRNDNNGRDRIDQLVAHGHLSARQARWAHSALTMLEQDGSMLAPATLLHGDVRPT